MARGAHRSARQRKSIRQIARPTERRTALPWVNVDKSSIFDGPSGKVTLAELFTGRTQLFIQPFMMGPVRGRDASADRGKSKRSANKSAVPKHGPQGGMVEPTGRDHASACGCSVPR